MNDKLLTTKQVAELFNVATSTVDRWRKAGLKCQRLGYHSMRFGREDVEEFLKQFTKAHYRVSVKEAGDNAKPREN